MREKRWLQQRSWGGQRKKRIDAKKEEDICFSKKYIFFGGKDIFRRMGSKRTDGVGKKRKFLRKKKRRRVFQG